MRRFTLVLASFVVGFTSVAPAATSGTSTSLASGSTLAIDGTPCERLLSWEGGDLRGSVVTQTLASGLSNKTLGAPAVAPLVIQVSLPLSAQLATLINELCSGQAVRHTLLVTDYDFSGAATAAFQLTGAMLSEVTFPACDAATSPLGPMKLVFSAEQSAAAKTGATTGSITTRKTAASFRLAIDGVDGSGIIRIEPLTVRRRVSTDSVGETRTGGTTTLGIEFSNLCVSLSTAKSGTWRTWWTDFVVNGNATDANEKAGSLTLLDAGMTPLDFVLNFQHLGILRATRLPATSTAPSKTEAEIYFEGLAIAKLPPPETGSTGSTGAASTGGSSPPPLAERTPTVTETTLKSPVGETTPTLATNPADLGSRDPAQFPRVDGLTRTYYAGTYQSTYTSEQASYTSAESLAQLVSRVDAAAKAAGWTLTVVEESGTASEKTVTENWTKSLATAGVSYRESTTAPGTKLDVQVYIQLTAPN